MPIEEPRPDPHTFLFELMLANGYLAGRVLSDELVFVIGAYGSFFRRMLCQNGDRTGWVDSWDYETLLGAERAMADCDGNSEPKGWYRNMTRGRRISRSPDEWDQDGKRVGSVGVEYIRF